MERSTSPLRVLVFEESRVMGELVGKVIREFGAQVEAIARSQDEGVRLWAEHLPDVVVVPVWGPGDPGLDLIERLRQTYGAIQTLTFPGGAWDELRSGLGALTAIGPSAVH